MTENVSFTLDGFTTEYMDWQKEDRRTLDKVNKLIKDIIKHGVKPRPSGLWI